MPVVLTRIDDRLIHGQVVVGWTRTVEGTFILVIDDAVANNVMQKKLLKFATPTGVNSEIVGIDEGVHLLTNGTYDKENLIVLLKSPFTAKALIEKGVSIQRINIGNIRSTPERKQLLKGVNASKEEIDAWKDLDKKGVTMVAQQFPDQKKYDFNGIIRQE